MRRIALGAVTFVTAAISLAGCASHPTQRHTNSASLSSSPSPSCASLGGGLCIGQTVHGSGGSLGNTPRLGISAPSAARPVVSCKPTVVGATCTVWSRRAATVNLPESVTAADRWTAVVQMDTCGYEGETACYPVNIAAPALSEATGLGTLHRERAWAGPEAGITYLAGIRTPGGSLPVAVPARSRVTVVVRTHSASRGAGGGITVGKTIHGHGGA